MPPPLPEGPPWLVNPVPLPRSFLAPIVRHVAFPEVREWHREPLPIADRTVPAILAICRCPREEDVPYTQVLLQRFDFQVESWLLGNLYLGRCPHCRRGYWG